MSLHWPVPMKTTFGFQMINHIELELCNFKFREHMLIVPFALVEKKQNNHQATELFAWQIFHEITISFKDEGNTSSYRVI